MFSLRVSLFQRLKTQNIHMFDLVTPLTGGEAVRYLSSPSVLLTTIFVSYPGQGSCRAYVLVNAFVVFVEFWRHLLVFLGKTSPSSHRFSSKRNVVFAIVWDRTQVNTPQFCQGVAADLQPANCTRQ